MKYYLIGEESHFSYFRWVSLALHWNSISNNKLFTTVLTSTYIYETLNFRLKKSTTYLVVNFFVRNSIGCISGLLICYKYALTILNYSFKLFPQFFTFSFERQLCQLFLLTSTFCERFPFSQLFDLAATK